MSLRRPSKCACLDTTSRSGFATHVVLELTVVVQGLLNGRTASAKERSSESVTHTILVASLLRSLWLCRCAGRTLISSSRTRRCTATTVPRVTNDFAEVLLCFPEERKRLLAQIKKDCQVAG